jgi:hypothetical protein
VIVPDAETGGDEIISQLFKKLIARGNVVFTDVTHFCPILEHAFPFPIESKLILQRCHLTES